jgi:hypothetical protein
MAKGDDWSGALMITARPDEVNGLQREASRMREMREIGKNKSPSLNFMRKIRK